MLYFSFMQFIPILVMALEFALGILSIYALLLLIIVMKIYIRKNS
jgi:hypothetical protein